ncbi:MAG: hypothetical protein ACUVRV_04600 [Cyanobacteriota bacterium]
MLPQLPEAALTSETLQQELLISPVLTGMPQLSIEVNHILQGEVNCLLHGKQQRIVIEASRSESGYDRIGTRVDCF